MMYSKENKNYIIIIIYFNQFNHSYDVIAIFRKHMGCSTLSAFKARIWFYFHSLWAFVHLMTDYLTTLAHNHI